MPRPKKTSKKSSKRRYYKRRYRRYKKYYNRRRYTRHVKAGTPEIRKSDETFKYHSGSYPVTGWMTNGQLTNISTFSLNNNVVSFNGVPIVGNKIRLKYIYVKGYIACGARNANDPDMGIDLRLSVYRKLHNPNNTSLGYYELYDNALVPNNVSDWGYDADGFTTEHNILYNYEYRPDIKNQIKVYETTKHLTYKDSNMFIPFKLRINCNCILQNEGDNPYPSRNAFFMGFMMTHRGEFEAKGPDHARIRVRLYWTDY